MRAGGLLVGGFTRKMKSVDCCSRIQPHHRLSPTDCGVFAHFTSCDQNVVPLNLADSTLLETAYHPCGPCINLSQRQRVAGGYGIPKA